MQHQPDTKPVDPQGPTVKSIWDFSSEALQELKTWLEMAGLVVPLSHVIGGGNFGITGYVDYFERTDPDAPAADTARVYSRDNGSGKTQLCVRFPTGAVQVLATEP